MKYEYSKDKGGSDILKIDSEDKYLTDYHEVNVSDGYIDISDYLYRTDPYDGNQVSISVESWEEFKAFVDSQIKSGEINV